MKQLVEKGNYCGFFTIRVSSIQIIESEGELIPYDLLLLADPSREMIDKYLSSSEIFLAKDQKHIIGILVLKREQNAAEIMNVAVGEKLQGKGVGTQLLQHVIQYCREAGIKQLSIGTADTSLDQIIFYQKLGFKVNDRIADFFLKNYEKPIYENGKQAKDMIRLEMSLT